jgi:nucleoid DNA-binding protein
LKYRRKHLDRYFAKEAKIKVPDAEDISKYFLKAFQQFLIDMKVGDSLEIRGFGTFRVKYSKGRTNARNPRTGEPAVIPAKRRLAFVPSDLIKREYKKL